MSQLPALIQQPAKRLPLTRTALLCPACFWVGSPGSRLRGSGMLESLLWGMGIATLGLTVAAGTISFGLACLPGLFYSVWRRYRRSRRCPQCGRHPLVPEEDAYPPACSHFLFSAEPTRSPAHEQDAPRPVIEAPHKTR